MSHPGFRNEFDPAQHKSNAAHLSLVDHWDTQMYQNSEILLHLQL